MFTFERKRLFAAVLAAVLFVTALAGCDPSDNSSGTASGTTVSTKIIDDSAADPLMGEGNNGPIKMKVWGPDPYIHLLRQQCDRFSETMAPYGDVQIEVVPQGEADTATNVLTDPESSADVFGFACDNLNRLVKAGLLLEVTGDEQAQVETENSPSSVEAAKIGGKLYAYPETGDNSYCLVYNRVVVSDEDAKTFEGVLRACKAANKKFVMSAGNGFYSCMFLFTGGITLEGFEKDGETQKFNEYDEERVVKTMMAFRSLLFTYKDYFVSSDVTKIADGFKSDTVGAGIDGSWDFKNIKDTLGGRAGFATLPTINVDGEPTQIINMFGYKLIGVNSCTKYPHTSKELARYLAGEECQMERAEQLNWGPSNINAAESDVVKNDAAISAILAQSKYSVPQTQISDTFWAPLKSFGNTLIDFEANIDDNSCRELLRQTISSIRDE